ncbi:50S ribosomal protein L18 [Candidatus Pacebacteria bacterium]|nr:50S ribosomal protein L18 [Candidatus Paceibacterota bacterium]
MTNNTQQKTAKRAVRHKRIRSRVAGTATRPRLAVYRSNKALYAQLIDDEAQKTLAAADSRKESGSPSEAATAVGKAIAEKAKAAKIETVVFDRGGFKYQGGIAALADAAREAGLKF